jgi:uncharacterized protein (DUF2336 family)
VLSGRKLPALTSFEALTIIAVAGLVGRNKGIMSEYAASQGFAPVTAVHPLEGAPAAGHSEMPGKRSVSADSFRKLTALLKKDSAPVPPSVIPEIIIHQQPPQPQPRVEFKIEPEVLDVLPLPVIEHIAAPVETVVVPPVVAPVEPVLVEPEIETPTPVPIIVAPAPKPVRQRPRDAFAAAPTLIAPRPAVVPIAQTPAQEAEAAELARSLLDMMASSGSTGLPQERALAADTLLRMLPRLPLKSMVMLAERLRLMDNPPHLLVAKLIADTRIEVAGPLLEDCMHITDEDLISVVHEGHPAKRRMIARRRKLPRAIVSQLVASADASVNLTLVRNAGAEIPHEAFEALAVHATEHSDLLAPLCTRADLPVPFAFELFWLAPAQLRRYLLSRFLTDSETLTKILKIALVTNSEEGTNTSFPEPARIRSALDLAAAGDLENAAAALGECAQIDAATAARILADRQGEPLAALLKATGVPRAQTAEIFASAMSSASGLLDSARDPEELQSLFDSLSFNKARILLTYWDWATLKTGPYAALN